MEFVLVIRNATVEDVPLLLAMLREASIEQGFPGELVATEANLREDGFGPQPRFRAVIAEWEQAPAGMALFFFNYSTWGSRNGLYLEDLYVDPRYRKKGVGRALLIHLAQVAVAEGCGRFQWVVHCENARAVRLYESIGAASFREWTLMSLKGEAIAQLAGATSTP
jgi:GNAT superfamily N-acetyltransferase